MRILYLSRTAGPHDHRFLAAMVGMGHSVRWARLGGPTGTPPDRVDPIDWVGGRRAVRFWDAPQLRAGLRSVIRASRPDVIHAGPVQDVAFLAAAAGAVPLVTMSWGSDILVGAASGLGRWIAGWTLRQSELLLCDCQVVRRACLALGMAEDRIVVFPWGVDLDWFTPAGEAGPRKQLGWQDAIVLLSARSLEATYGVELLVEGFMRAARSDPRLRLLALGEGSLQPSLTERLNKARMLDRVHWAGTVPLERLPAYYRSADWYLSASRSDGSSVSLLEAMACGLPAIVSDIPGNREWVEQGLNGMLFAASDTDGLAGRLARAAAMGAERAEWGARSRAIAEARADWRAGVDKLRAAYERAAASGGKGR